MLCCFNLPKEASVPVNSPSSPPPQHWQLVHCQGLGRTVAWSLEIFSLYCCIFCVSVCVCAKGRGWDEWGRDERCLSFLFLLCFEWMDATGEHLPAWAGSYGAKWLSKERRRLQTSKKVNVSECITIVYIWKLQQGQ